MDEAVTHCINSHQRDEAVHPDANALALNIQDDGGSRVAILHSQTFSTSLCRQVSVGEQVEGQWGEELIDPEGRLAALMAQISAQQNRLPPQLQHKVQMRDVESSIILDNSMRLFHGQLVNVAQEYPQDALVVDTQHLPPLPPLQDMKQCQSTSWFNKDDKTSHKDDSSMVDSDGPVLELGAGASPAHNKHHSKKSLPHKKRISRKLKRNNGMITPQQDIVVISCSEVEGRISCGPQASEQEILPDNYVQQEHLPDDAHHISHEVRPVLLCQLCGEFYGEEQLKFFQHLKQHYEPYDIIIENPVPDLGIDKMANSCLVDNVMTTIPDSIVELSLDNSIPKTMYQSIDKSVLYTTSDKTLTHPNNKVQYSMASMDKEPVVTEAEKTDLYETLDRLELYSCGKCSKTFRKAKQCEQHMKEAHSNMKLEDMGEFSEPEDLMEGIHVAVEEPADNYEHSILPHLTVENGQAHQENVRHWCGRAGCASCAGCAYCALCPRARSEPQHLNMLKEELLERILDTEVTTQSSTFTENMMTDSTDVQAGTPAMAPLPSELTPPTPSTPHSPAATPSAPSAPSTPLSPPLAPSTPRSPPPESSATSAPPAPTTPDASTPDSQQPDDKTDTKKKVKHFFCSHCSRVFQHRNSLLYHMLSHAGKQHTCWECGKEFYTVASLRIHKRMHSDDRPHKCDMCSKAFRQWSDLKYHKVSIHSNQKSFKCEFCGKEFARKYSLNVHRRIHTGEKNYKCEYCNKSFRASSYRLSHMRTHTGDKPHKCPECGKCFRVGGDLRRHILTHQKVRNRQEENRNKGKDKVINKPEDDTEDKINKAGDPSKNMRKFAVASTAKTPTIVKNVEKKTPKAKKNQNAKKGAPNVTVDDINMKYSDAAYDPQHAQYDNVKEVYNTAAYNKHMDNTFNKEIIDYKDEQSEERELAILRPMFRNDEMCDSVEPTKLYRTENTDGKMQVYTHIEKSKDMSGIVHDAALSDVRLERQRSELGEHSESGFIERLTALYNISAV